MPQVKLSFLSLSLPSTKSVGTGVWSPSPTPRAVIQLFGPTTILSDLCKSPYWFTGSHCDYFFLKINLCPTTALTPFSEFKWPRPVSPRGKSKKSSESISTSVTCHHAHPCPPEYLTPLVSFWFGLPLGLCTGDLGLKTFSFPSSPKLSQTSGQPKCHSSGKPSLTSLNLTSHYRSPSSSSVTDSMLPVFNVENNGRLLTPLEAPEGQSHTCFPEV